VTSIPWVVPMAFTGRAFSALVKKKFTALCASFLSFVSPMLAKVKKELNHQGHEGKRRKNFVLMVVFVVEKTPPTAD